MLRPRSLSRLLSVLVVAGSLTAAGCGGGRKPAKTDEPTAKENSQRACEDLVDNDGDNKTDCADSDCAIFCDTTNLTESACADTQDNDGDGKIDCADSDCGPQQGCGSESTDARCADGRDNDNDALLDCADPDCQDSEDVDFCGAENTTDRCRDSLDNDNDGKIDCQDLDCAAASPCVVTTPENNASSCANNLDDDGDGLRDCRDPDCRGAAVGGCAAEESGALCSDTIDNDGDGFTNCADSGCTSTPACATATPENTAVSCKNGLDDDGDGDIDCGDENCRTASVVTYCGAETGAKCNDQIDNDGDGGKDCTDADCGAAPNCAPVDAEDTSTECSDGQDNDSDGKPDCKDTGCQALPVCGAENTTASCSDGLDNDADDKIDCADTDCAAVGSCANPENDTTECGDGTDNDSDGKIDCKDPSCATDTRCQATETTCNDNFDNDGDGQKDCADADCVANAACASSIETSCTNNLDDDGDGFIDCADPTCLLDFAQTACDTPAFTIRDLQDATKNDLFTFTRADGELDPVRLRNLVVTHVSASDPTTVFVQDVGVTGGYHGIELWLTGQAASATLARGDKIDVAGLVGEWYGETEIDVYAVQKTGTATLPTPESPTFASLWDTLPVAEQGNDEYWELDDGTVLDPEDDLTTAERHEGMLVKFTSVEVVGEWNDDNGDLEVVAIAKAPYVTGDDVFFVGGRFLAIPVATGQLVDSVTGVLGYTRYTLGTGFLREYRLEPRNAADWVYTAVVDSDGDGLSDDEEADLGTDPNDADTDRDFYEDGVEVGDPLAPYDTDFDGVIDALESYLLDVDGDGVSNELDYWELTLDSDDRDADGIINSEDDDDDNDYICDPGAPVDSLDCLYVDGLADPCPFAPSAPASADWPDNVMRNTDGDAATGDGYDGSASGDACDLDPDGDFWFGSFDNCAYDFNPSQDDADFDGFGDECDYDFFVTPLACDVTYNGGLDGCDLIIEEVLFNLSSSAPEGVVDANRDGCQDPLDGCNPGSDDEFVELRNVSVFDLDLSGMTLEDNASLAGTVGSRHVFPEGTILRAGQRLVVFAGGTPQFFPDTVVVQVASSVGLGLNNAGDAVYLLNAEGDTIIAELDFTDSSNADVLPYVDYNVSITRYPEGTDLWYAHPLIYDAGLDDFWSVSPGSAPDNGLP